MPGHCTPSLLNSKCYIFRQARVQKIFTPMYYNQISTESIHISQHMQHIKQTLVSKESYTIYA